MIYKLYHKRYVDDCGCTIDISSRSHMHMSIHTDHIHLKCSYMLMSSTDSWAESKQTRQGKQARPVFSLSTWFLTSW